MSWFLEWINTNANTIAAVCTSGTFVTLLCFIGNLITSNKFAKNNKLNSTTLTSCFTDIGRNNIKLNKLNEYMLQTIEQMNTMSRKINVILDIVFLCASRSKDSDIRNIAANAMVSLNYAKTEEKIESNDAVAEEPTVVDDVVTDEAESIGINRG